MRENRLISSIGSSRSAYNKLVPFVRERDLTDFGNVIFNAIQSYYETDKEAAQVDWELLKESVALKLPKLKNLVNEYISSLPTPSSSDNLVKLFLEVQKEKLGLELVGAITSKNENKTKELMEQYLSHTVENSKEEVFNSVPIEDIEVHFNSSNLIPIYPTELNRILGGGVPRQAQICIFARPDVGKSTVAINIAVGAAESGFKVLYLGNEDPAPKMVFRILTRFCRVSEQVLRSDTKKYYELALERGYSNLTFVSLHPGTISEIRSWIEKEKPDVVVVDQIRNLHVNSTDGTTNLEEASKACRNLAKEFNYVSIVVTQAGNSASNKLRLEMEDVDNSKTGLQGAMDLMIGIGQTSDLKQMKRVMLSFPKNKLCSPIQPFTAEIDYECNRILA